MPHMTQDMKGIARLGRFEDDTLAHVATGEMIVPPVIRPETRQMVQQDMQNVGLNPNEYMVGGNMSINPNTGLPEFGFLSKVFKKIKNVVKKVAPIAVNFIPGVGPLAKAAITAGVGKASGMSTKDALLGGALSFAGSKFFGGTPTGTGTGTAASTGRFSRIKNFFNPAEGATGIRGGTLGPNIRRGIGSLFGGGQQQQLPEITTTEGGFGDLTYQLPDGRVVSRSDLQKMGYSFDAQGMPVASQQGSVSDYDPVTGKGQSKIGKIEDFFKSMRGGQEGQSGIGRIEDFLKGRSSDDVRGGGMGNLGIAGLAGLVGKLAYDEAKDFKGVPLTPLTTTDQLGRYNIAAEIARQKGEEMPSRAEYGLNPQAMPALQGGMPRSAAQGGIIDGFSMGGLASLVRQGIKKIADKPIKPSIKANLITGGLSVPSLSGLVMTSVDIKNTNDLARQIGANSAIEGKSVEQAVKDFETAFYNRESLNKKANEMMGGQKEVIPQYMYMLVNDSYNETMMKMEEPEPIYESGELVPVFAKGGVVEMANGGEPPIDPANFPVMNGQIDGPGTETSDDIPAMLSDGEFVMTAKAVKGAGTFDVAKNDSSGIVTLTPNGDPSRDGGTRVMYKLMEHFGSMA